MSRRAERVKDPGLRCWSVADDGGESPALLTMAATVRTFPRWSAATMTTRRDVQLINAVSKLDRTYMEY